MIFEVREKIFVKNPTDDLREWCRSELVIPNPEYEKKVRMGLWTGSTPRSFALYERIGDGLVIPFGCLRELYGRYGSQYAFKSHIKPSEKVLYDSHINPYDYQEKAIQEATERRNGILVMPCGAGKTNCGLEIISRFGVPTLWLTHTQDLLNQSMNRAKSVLGIAQSSYGTITGGKVNIGTGITFATVQTMSKIDLAPYRNVWGCVVVDECFPGNTLVTTIDGQKEIKNLLHGELVASYNRYSGRIEFKPVVNTFKLVAHDLLKVTLCNGTTVDATSNHPFFVKGKGWICAEEMEVGDYVMQLVRQGVRRNEKAEHDKSTNKKTWLRLLLPKLRIQSGTSETGMDGGAPGKVCGTHEESECGISRTDHGAHDKKKSNEKPGSEGKGICTAERDRTQAKGAWWKWYRNDCTAKDARRRNAEKIGRSNCFRGISDSNKGGKKFRLSDLLQGRCCTRGADDCDRNRRKFSLFCRKAKSGCEENSVFNWVGVDSIEVQEQTSDGTFGGLCTDGCVYNIEVADNNNYFANSILVHNCHKAVGTPTKAMQFYRVLSALSCRYKYGITATPKRSDGLHRTMTALLGDIIYTVDREDVADTTCSVVVEQIRTGYEPDTSIALCGDGTINYAGLVSDMTHNQERFNLVREVIDNNCSGPTLVLANRVEYLSLMCDSVKKKSICLSSMGNSKKAKAERKDALRKLNDGKIDCIFATYQLAAEGLDCPNLRYVVFATPEKNERIVEQASGRVARKAEGKKAGTIIDLIDDFGMLYGWSKKRTNLYKKLGYAII